MMFFCILRFSYFSEQKTIFKIITKHTLYVESTKNKLDPIVFTFFLQDYHISFSLFLNILLKNNSQIYTYKKRLKKKLSTKG